MIACGFRIVNLVKLTKLAALTGALLLTAESAIAQVPVVRIDGSSTVFPITEAVAEEFQTSKRGKVRVTVGISGTGGGFKKLCRGEVDIQNASRPIQKNEIDACRAKQIGFLELPIAYDATVVVVHPKNTWVSNITVAELKKMWEPAAQGKIHMWSDVNPAWPQQKLKLFGAGADSGTFDYFTEAIVGKARSSRGDYTASEDDNTLITGIAGDVNSIGYVPLAYYEENKSKLKVLGIIGGEKAPMKDKAVMPNRETVENGTYYPLSRPVFIYVSDAAIKRPEIREFTDFYLQNAPQLVVEAKYVPLPKKAYDIGLEHVKSNKVGTVFGGKMEVGIKLEELMKKEGSL